MSRRPASSGAPRLGVPGDVDLDELCALVERRTRMTVSETKRGVVAVRLAARLRELRLASIEAYCRLLERDSGELLYVIDLITTHETGFFRHAHHFAFLETQLLPHWRKEAAHARRPHEIRAWSAGCSTGEEPYSIAMVLAGALSATAGWTMDVLATDISDAALASARTAMFAPDRAWQIPDDYRRLFTREATRAGRPAIQVRPEIAHTVRFERVNLLDEIYPVGRDYDLVFCRNVLIYFRPEVRRAVVDRLVDHLAPDGHLILGQAEGLLGASRLRRVAPTVYRVASPALGSIPPVRRAPPVARSRRGVAGLRKPRPHEGETMKPRRPLQVLLVDDSALARELIGAVLTGAGMRVTIAADGEAALDEIRRKRPDVVVLDLLLPRLDGLGFLRRSRGASPLPVVVCSNMEAASETAKRALEEGAVAIVAKPRVTAAGAVERRSADTLVSIVRRSGRRGGESARPAPLREAPPPRTSAPLPVRGQAPALIAIGASTGGTDALRTVLAEIPFDAPPIVVVQHMTERFVASFAQRLAIACGADVREAQHGELLESRAVRLAPGSRHVKVGRSGRGLHVELVDGPPVSGHRPSVDVLFRSVAEVVGPAAVGVLMTGMGADGAEGLLAMKRAGALTIAQDRSTSVVFGMPGAAIGRGAAEQILPLAKIAGALFGAPPQAKRVASRPER